MTTNSELRSTEAVRATFRCEVAALRCAEQAIDRGLPRLQISLAAFGIFIT